jgi:hypothetical protein
MVDAARKRPTLDDLEALPRDVKGEIIEGVLYTVTRPRAQHQRLVRDVSGGLGGPFDRGRDGPGAGGSFPSRESS